jgi:hypothetical protein
MAVSALASSFADDRLPLAALRVSAFGIGIRH